MIEFLAFGTLWFFITAGILFLVLLISIFNDADRALWFTGLLLITFLFISGTWGVSWVLDNPLIVLRNIAMYIGIGLIWSIKEWYSYVQEKTKYFFTHHNLYDYDTATNKKKTKEQMIALLKDQLALDHNWGIITQWITYYPFYMIAWMLKDPIKMIATKISFIYSGITTNIINRATAKIKIE